MTVTILASDLTRILSEASQFAHRGTDLPMINCVRLAIMPVRDHMGEAVPQWAK